MVARAKPKRMYRTMQGRMVDIEKLRSANESVQAVGNMNVNARGDVLGSNGQVVTPKAEVIKKYYEQPKGKVSEGPASTKQKPAQQPQVEAKAVEPKKVATPKVATPKVAPKRTVAPKKGIDAALDGLE
jgi:hypothetical protein|tara:strand:- start:318 stop:704 length:387 start_codon:yes stop_codon:yes gene_type:complete